MAAAGWAARLRRSLPASTLGRHAQARRARPDADPRSADHLDGRAILSAGYPDATAHGEPASRALVSESQVGALHHARPGGGDFAFRSGGGAFRRPRVTS